MSWVRHLSFAAVESNYNGPIGKGPASVLVPKGFLEKFIELTIREGPALTDFDDRKNFIKLEADLLSCDATWWAERAFALEDTQHVQAMYCRVHRWVGDFVDFGIAVFC